RPVTARRQGADPACDQLLPRAALADDEHGRVDRRDLDDSLERLLDGRGLADDPRELPQATTLDQAAADERDLAHVDRLDEHLVEAETPPRIASGLLRRIRQPDDRQPIVLFGFPDELPRASLLQPAGQDEERGF